MLKENRSYNGSTYERTYEENGESQEVFREAIATAQKLDDAWELRKHAESCDDRGLIWLIGKGTNHWKASIINTTEEKQAHSKQLAGVLNSKLKELTKLKSEKLTKWIAESRHKKSERRGTVDELVRKAEDTVSQLDEQELQELTLELHRARVLTVIETIGTPQYEPVGGSATPVDPDVSKELVRLIAIREAELKVPNATSHELEAIAAMLARAQVLKKKSKGKMDYYVDLLPGFKESGRAVNLIRQRKTELRQRKKSDNNLP